MGNVSELAPDRNESVPTLGARLGRLSFWDWVNALVLVLWLAAIVVWIGGYYWWEAPLRTWIGLAASTPTLLSIGFSLVVIASETPSRHFVDRDSVLWRWLTGVGRGLRATTGLTIGAFIGVVVGSGLAEAETPTDLYPPLHWGLLAITVGAGLSMLWWTIIAAIDMGRLSRAERVAAVHRALAKTRKRRRGIAQFIADLSSPAAVLLWGLIGSFLLLQLYEWLRGLLATL